ncbi:MAG: NhaC family Na+:H+ antiporter [Phenylobacterium sp.]|jgi:NhaC family Na+:H+ antiporter
MSNHPDSQSTSSPSMADALIPLISLSLLLGLAVYYFGDDSSSGPNQIALMLCAGIATIVALKNGHQRISIEQAIVKGISLTTGAILILLAVGSLIGTWLLAGTVPTMIYYGLQILSPDLFYFSSCVLCAIVALCIGSSWTVAATIGVALMGIANGLNASPTITAGAIISGAYFGDKLSPLSDTTNLAPAIAGTELFTHIRFMLYSTVPSFIITLCLFLMLGFSANIQLEQGQISALQTSLEQQFFIAPYMLVPLLVTLALAVKKVPAFPAIGIGALTGALWAVLFQQDFILAYANAGLNGAGNIDQLTANITVVWRAMYEGVSLNSGNVFVDKLLSGGGMGAMLNTIWLIICAMIFGSVMEQAGLLRKVITALTASAKSTGALISSTIVTAFGTNCIAADQYIAIVMPGRMFKDEYQQRGLAPENLSRALEDGGTVTSALIPWNTCGAYMQSVLLINPLDYAVYAFFNWLNPLIGIGCAMLGFRVKRLVTYQAA